MIFSHKIYRECFFWGGGASSFQNSRGASCPFDVPPQLQVIKFYPNNKQRYEDILLFLGSQQSCKITRFWLQSQQNKVNFDKTRKLKKNAVKWQYQMTKIL
eukprot:TRINITY_DN43_c1_g1_i4.p8 TRINITY_DN43_c1_g1~~TRINITY_DN43_c1_g1_i4.p8  ORF type:complete len:101 (-),score=6.07 TRINITY_DN43_c1_g1_i4:236-538(-)